MTIPTPGTDPHTQTWWRFSRYELRDGYIRPAPDATLEEYAPWDQHRSGRDARMKKQQPPYQELVGVLHDFRYALDSSGTHVPEPKAEEALLDWCRRYGLLGLLPHQAQMVAFRPRYVWAPTIEFKDLVPSWESGEYVRQVGTWRVHYAYDSSDSPDRVLSDEDDPPTSLPNPSLCDEAPPDKPDDFPKPEVLTQNLDGHWERKSLDEGWFHYFPGADSNESTPLPLTPEFWKVYAEPLDDFVKAAAMLAMTMEYYTGTPRGGGRSSPPGQVTRVTSFEPAPDVPTRRKFPDVAYLRPEDQFMRLLQGVSPVVETTKRGTKWTHREVLRAPSLLGTLAAMLLTDVTQGQEMRICGVCSKRFVSGAHAAKYCSPTCRSRIIKARLRANMAKAQKLHGQGKSAAVIAKRLGSKVTTVRGWIKKAPAKRRPRSRRKT